MGAVSTLKAVGLRGAGRDVPPRPIHNAVDYANTMEVVMAIADARRYRIDYWRQVNVADPKEVKAQLNAGYPVMTGVTVDEGFMKAGPDYVWKEQDGESKGAHAIVLVGYDDDKHAFKLINSWGSTWGDRGYGWIDYTYFGQVANEAYVAKDAINTPPGPAVDPHPAPAPVVEPVPPPAADVVSIEVTKVDPTASFPDHPEFQFIAFDGKLHIPPGQGRVKQMVIYLFFEAGNGMPNIPVFSALPSFADGRGQAACGPPAGAISEEGETAAWHGAIPSAALVLPFGQSHLIALPVLFIDGFGVKSGPAIPFDVTR